MSRLDVLLKKLEHTFIVPSESSWLHVMLPFFVLSKKYLHNYTDGHIPLMMNGHNFRDPLIFLSGAIIWSELSNSYLHQPKLYFVFGTN